MKEIIKERKVRKKRKEVELSLRTATACHHMSLIDADVIIMSKVLQYDKTNTPKKKKELKNFRLKGGLF